MLDELLKKSTWANVTKVEVRKVPVTVSRSLEPVEHESPTKKSALFVLCPIIEPPLVWQRMRSLGDPIA